MLKSKISIFKPYLQDAAAYKGGRSRGSVGSEQKLHKLSSNENPLGSSPKALAAIAAKMDSLFEYPDNTDHRLQKALSKFYKHKLEASQFITANSGIGILELIVHAFLGEGLECIVSNPTFLPYIDFPFKVGAKIVDVPLIGNQFQLDVDNVLNSITDATRIIWLCSPNNPTGTYLPKADVDKIINGVPAHVIVVLDEVYWQYAQADDFTRALPYVLANKNVIAVNSFSKAYGLAGMRIGYAYSTVEIAEYVSKVRRPFLLSSLALEGAIAALEDTEFIERTVRTAHKGKAYLYAELDKHGIKYWKSEANFILIKPKMNDQLFEDRMLENGVMVRRAAGFGATDCIRVTIGDMEANAAFISALHVILPSANLN